MFSRILTLVLLVASLSFGDTINLGVLSFASNGATNRFTLDNYSSADSGIGCSGVDFPSCTPVQFTNLNLLVTFEDGSQLGFPGLGPVSATDPTLVLADFNAADRFLSARLTGAISDITLALFDLSSLTVDPAFDVTLSPDVSSGRLLLSPDGDSTVVSVDSAASAVPEPAALKLVGIGVLLISFKRARRASGGRLL